MGRQRLISLLHSKKKNNHLEFHIQSPSPPSPPAQHAPPACALQQGTHPNVYSLSSHMTAVWPTPRATCCTFMPRNASTILGVLKKRGDAVARGPPMCDVRVGSPAAEGHPYTGLVREHAVRRHAGHCRCKWTAPDCTCTARHGTARHGAALDST